MMGKPENCRLEGKGSAKFRSEEAFVSPGLKARGIARWGHPRANASRVSSVLPNSGAGLWLQVDMDINRVKCPSFADRWDS